MSLVPRPGARGAAGAAGEMALALPAMSLAAGELALALPVLRARDPFGTGAPRAPPPPDPDVYDREAEAQTHARSLYPAAARAELDSRPPMTIEEVRAFLADRAGDGATSYAECLTGELLAYLDARLAQKVFIHGDGVWSREEVWDLHPFAELGAQPEAVFSAQEIGVFPAARDSLDGALEYVARDAGDETVEFAMVEDLVRAAARPGAAPARPPLRVAKTKVYVGRQPFEDWLGLVRFMRAAHRLGRAQAAAGGGPFAHFAALGPPPAPAAPAEARDGVVGDAAGDARAARLAEAAAAVARAEEAARVAAALAADLVRVAALYDAPPAPPAAPAAPSQEGEGAAAPAPADGVAL